MTIGKYPEEDCSMNEVLLKQENLLWTTVDAPIAQKQTNQDWLNQDSLCHIVLILRARPVEPRID